MLSVSQIEAVEAELKEMQMAVIQGRKEDAKAAQMRMVEFCKGIEQTKENGKQLNDLHQQSMGFGK